MDIKCPRCTEPWDHDSLHDNDKGLDFDTAYKLFRTKGCGAVFNIECVPANNEKSRILTELAETLGYDSDAYAAMIEDYGL